MAARNRKDFFQLSDELSLTRNRSQHVTEKGRAALRALGYKIKDDNMWSCRYHAGESVCLKDEVTREGFDGLKSYAILVCGYAANPGDFASLIWAIAPWGASKATEIQVVGYDRLGDGPEFDRGTKIRVKKGDRITLVKVLKVRYKEWDGLFNKRPWDYKLENENEFIAGGLFSLSITRRKATGPISKNTRTMRPKS